MKTQRRVTLFVALILTVLFGSEAIVHALDRCTPQVIIPAVIVEADSQFLHDLRVNFNCTGGNPGSITSADFTMTLNTGVAPDALLLVDDPLCLHLVNSILCPLGVPPGSNSKQFNPDGTILFPGLNGSTISVPPTSIIPNPFPMSGLQTTPNQITWHGVPIIQPAQTGNRLFSITNIHADPNPLFSQTRANQAILATVSSPQLPNVNLTVPLAVVASGNPGCGQSFVSITPGYNPFVLATNVAVGGSVYNGFLPVVTHPDGSISLTVATIGTGYCINTGNSLDLRTSQLSLGSANLKGTTYLAGLKWNGSNALLLQSTTQSGCIGPEIDLFDTWNKKGIANNGTPPTFNTGGKSYCLVRIEDYHYNNFHGALPGTIGLNDSTGINVAPGPWQAVGTTGQANVPDANWIAAVPAGEQVVINGTYTVIDSDPATWSQNSDSGGFGFARVWVKQYVGPTPTAPIQCWKPSLLKDLLFVVDLQQSDLIWVPDLPLGAGWVDKKTGQRVDGSKVWRWRQDLVDPNRAFNDDTGQNAVWDSDKQQWIDTKTGQPLSRSGK